MNWYENYYENSSLSDELLNKYKNYIPKDTDDDYFEDNFKETMDKINNFNETEKNEILKGTSLKILSEEFEIIKLLSKYTLQNNYLNYSFFVKAF